MIQINQKNLDMFYWFIKERQNIWYKRNILKQSRPWTEDSILQQFRFTNIFRLLDKGTQFLVHNILTNNTNKKDLLYNIIFYRIFNRIDTYEEVGWQKLDNFNKDILIKKLKEKQQRDNFHIFSKAYMTTGFKFGGSNSKIENYVWVLQKIFEDIDNLYNILKNSNDMKKDWEYVKQYNGIGGFLSQQILTDVSYTNIVKYDNNGNFTHAGNGATLGLQYIFPNIIDNLNGLFWLRDNQYQYLKNFNFDIPIPKHVKHCCNIVGLQDIENTCCELSKYIRLKNNEGKKRKFTPNITNQQQTINF